MSFTQASSAAAILRRLVFLLKLPSGIFTIWAADALAEREFDLIDEWNGQSYCRKAKAKEEYLVWLKYSAVDSRLHFDCALSEVLTSSFSASDQWYVDDAKIEINTTCKDKTDSARMLTLWLSATRAPLSSINATSGSETVILLACVQNSATAVSNQASNTLNNPLSARLADITGLKSAFTYDNPYNGSARYKANGKDCVRAVLSYLDAFRDFARFVVGVTIEMRSMHRAR